MLCNFREKGGRRENNDSFLFFCNYFMSIIIKYKNCFISNYISESGIINNNKNPFLAKNWII